MEKLDIERKIDSLYEYINKKKSIKKKIYCEVLSANAIIPEKKSEFAAGYDLFSTIDKTILPDKLSVLIPLDLAIKVPLGTYGRIAPRSSLALKNIHVGAGVIDHDYCGNVSVLLYNLSNSCYEVKKGDRIAQLIIEKINNNTEILVADKLETTKRGISGFGSTGV